MTYIDDYAFCRQHLAAGEYILWQGKPEKGNLITRSDMILIPFSIFWCVFSVVWELTAIRSAPRTFALFGIPFVAMGLYLLFGRFLWTAYLRKRTYYVITNKKIIRSRNGRLDMLYASAMPAVRVEIFRNGNGTLYFGHGGYNGGWGHHARGSGDVFKLENIANVAAVQQAIGNMER